MALDDAHRHIALGRLRRQRLQLQEQAFLEIARADARRVEALHQLQRRAEIFRAHVLARGHERHQVVERHLEVAVVLEAVDDHVREPAVAIIHRQDHQLLAQVLRERRLRVVQAAPVVLLAIDRPARAWLLRHDDIVDVPPLRGHVRVGEVGLVVVDQFFAAVVGRRR